MVKLLVRVRVQGASRDWTFEANEYAPGMCAVVGFEEDGESFGKVVKGPPVFAQAVRNDALAWVREESLKRIALATSAKPLSVPDFPQKSAKNPQAERGA